MLKNLARLSAAALLLAGLGVGASIAGAAFARSLEIDTARLAVAPDFLPDGFEFLIGYELRADDPRFGGVSGIVLTATEVTAVTDGGAYIQMDVIRDGSGAIAEFGEAVITPQLDFEGTPVDHQSADAEALALDPVSGVLWTAYERKHRIIGRRTFDASAVAEIGQLPIGGLTPDGGIEAMAVARDRAVFAVASGPVSDGVGSTTDIAGWRLAVDRADRFSIARTEGFAPSAADFAPNGDFFLLERRGDDRGGRAFRIRRFAADVMRGMNAEDHLGEGEVVLLLTARAPIGDMEGLYVDAARDGRTVFTVVSDDHYAEDGRTLLLQFAMSAAEKAEQ